MISASATIYDFIIKFHTQNHIFTTHAPLLSQKNEKTLILWFCVIWENGIPTAIGYPLNFACTSKKFRIVTELDKKLFPFSTTDGNSGWVRNCGSLLDNDDRWKTSSSS